MEKRDVLVELLGIELQLESQVPRLEVLETGHGIDFDPEDLVGGLLGDFFDVHAALSAGHDHHATYRTIEKNRQVQLALDVAAFLDEDPPDDLARWPGLLRHQDVAEDLRRDLAGVGRRLRQLHAARFVVLGKALSLEVRREHLRRLALVRDDRARAAAARVNLGLHDDDGGAEIPRGLFGVGRFLDHDVTRHAHAVLSQQGLALVFVEIHSPLPIRALPQRR